MNKLRQFRQQAGQGMTEYIIIVALIAVVIIVAVVLLGRNLSGIFNKAATAIPTT